MKNFSIKFFLIMYVLSFSFTNAQNGPGGIGSVEGSSSLELWLKADTGVSTIGNDVDAWADQSGNELTATQTTSSLRPVLINNQLNSQPVIRFSSDYLNLGQPSALLFTPGVDLFTIVSVVEGDYGTIFSRAQAPNSNNQYSQQITDFRCRYYIGGGGNPGIQLINDGSYHILVGKVNTSNISSYIDGNLDINAGSIGSNTVSDIDVLIGAKRNTDNTDAYYYLAGDVAELIVYSDTLKSVERIIIDNYISAKYDIAIINDRYAGDDTGNGDYDLNVTGMGQEAGESHIRSGAAGIVLIENNSSLDDDDYLFAGHKVKNNSVTGSDVPTGVEARWARVWYIDKTGSIDATIAFDFSDGGVSGAPGTSSNYRLLFRSSQSGDFSTVTVSGTNVSGDSVLFDVANSNLTDGYYTLGSTNLTDSPLPVDFIAFTAKGGDEHITLRWSTASEVDNQGYVVLRSNEKEGDYKEIDSFIYNTDLKGAGTTSNRTSYTYTDHYLINGQIYWYKIADVDFYGRQVMHGPVSAVPHVDEMEVIDKNYPHSFTLNQNYPNPFNPSTKISFDIPDLKSEIAEIKIHIYDILGKKVKTLYKGQIAPGSYEIEWDGLDSNGQSLPSGIYIYQLISDRFNQSRKMMYLK